MFERAALQGQSVLFPRLFSSEPNKLLQNANLIKIPHNVTVINHQFYNYKMQAKFLCEVGWVCFLMTPGLHKDIWDIMYDHAFSKLANHQIRHKATQKVGCQPGDCIWSL